MKTVLPQKQISPLPSVSLSTSFTLHPGAGLPQLPEKSRKTPQDHKTSNIILISWPTCQIPETVNVSVTAKISLCCNGPAAMEYSLTRADLSGCLSTCWQSVLPCACCLFSPCIFRHKTTIVFEVLHSSPGPGLGYMSDVVTVFA